MGRLSPHPHRSATVHLRAEGRFLGDLDHLLRDRRQVGKDFEEGGLPALADLDEGPERAEEPGCDGAGAAGPCGELTVEPLAGLWSLPEKLTTTEVVFSGHGWPACCASAADRCRQIESTWRRWKPQPGRQVLPESDVSRQPGPRSASTVSSIAGFASSSALAHGLVRGSTAPPCPSTRVPPFRLSAVFRTLPSSAQPPSRIAWTDCRCTRSVRSALRQQAE